MKRKPGIYMRIFKSKLSNCKRQLIHCGYFHKATTITVCTSSPDVCKSPTSSFHEAFHLHRARKDPVIATNTSASFLPQNPLPDLLFTRFLNRVIAGKACNHSMYGGISLGRISGGWGEDGTELEAILVHCSIFHPTPNDMEYEEGDYVRIRLSRTHRTYILWCWLIPCVTCRLSTGDQFHVHSTTHTSTRQALPDGYSREGVDSELFGGHSQCKVGSPHKAVPHHRPCNQ